MTIKKPTMKEVKETKAYNIKDVSLTLHRIDEDKRVLVRQKDRNDGVAEMETGARRLSGTAKKWAGLG